MSVSAARVCPEWIMVDAGEDQLQKLDRARAGDLVMFIVTPDLIALRCAKNPLVWLGDCVVLIGANVGDSRRNSSVTLDLQTGTFSDPKKLLTYCKHLSYSFMQNFEEFGVVVRPLDPFLRFCFGEVHMPDRFVSRVKIYFTRGEIHGGSIFGFNDDPNGEEFAGIDGYAEAIKRGLCTVDKKYSLDAHVCVITDGFPVRNGFDLDEYERCYIDSRDGGHVLYEDDFQRKMLQHGGRWFPCEWYDHEKYEWPLPVKIDKTLFLVEYYLFNAQSSNCVRLIRKSFDDLGKTLGHIANNRETPKLKTFDARLVPPGKHPSFVAGQLCFVNCDRVTEKMALLANDVLLSAALGLASLELPVYVVLWITEWLHFDVCKLPDVRRIRTLEAIRKCHTAVSTKRKAKSARVDAN